MITKNNDGTPNTTNINKFEVEYKLSIDNDKFIYKNFTNYLAPIEYSNIFIETGAFIVVWIKPIVYIKNAIIELEYQLNQWYVYLRKK